MWNNALAGTTFQILNIVFPLNMRDHINANDHVCCPLTNFDVLLLSISVYTHVIACVFMRLHHISVLTLFSSFIQVQMNQTMHSQV